MIIDFQLIVESLPLLLQGLAVTLKIALYGSLIGVTLGTALALLERYGHFLIRYCVALYIIIIRGTPMLIQILCAFYVLPQLGINISQVATAVLAIGLNSAAYISQIVKAGMSSIGKGQIEAGQVLGLSKTSIMCNIIAPQTVRMILPALGNEFVTLVKDSALASTIGVAELSKQGRLIISKTYDGITIFFILALLYLLITSTISLIVYKFEQRMALNVRN